MHGHRTTYNVPADTERRRHGARGTVVRVEEGGFRDGKWVRSMVWNGDLTDYGINLVDRPHVLKIMMRRFR